MILGNEYVPGLCTYYTFYYDLERTPVTYTKVCCEAGCRVILAAASYTQCLPLLPASFTLVLDLTLCAFVQCHAARAGGMAATSRWAVGTA